MRAHETIYQSREDYMVMMIADPPALKSKTRGLWQKEDIPPELAWIERLSPLHYRMFIAELHDAVGAACIDEDWDRVAQLLEDWEATALLDANPKFAALLKTDPPDEEYDELDVSKLG